MVKGNYGTQAERYWAALRKSINDLAICYNLTPAGGLTAFEIARGSASG